MYATLCNNNASVTVYGLGSALEAAENEARETYAELGWDWENYVTIRVGVATAERIEAGIVDAADLGIDLSPHRCDLGIAR